MKYVKVLRGIFYVEILINIVTAIISFFSPVQYATLFTSQPGGPVTDLLRWYGILLVVFAYVELRALLSKRDEILTVIIEGFLVGDLLQLVALVMFVHAFGGWNQNLLATLWITIVLACSRICWLWIYYSKKSRNRASVAEPSK